MSGEFPSHPSEFPDESRDPLSREIDDLDLDIVRGGTHTVEEPPYTEPIVASRDRGRYDQPAEPPAEEAESPVPETETTPAVTEVSETTYDSIIPTALLAAGWRTYSTMPLSREVYDAATRLWEADGHQPPALFEPEKHAPAHEARQRVTDQIIEESDNSQTLDIAAGLTPRGLRLTEDPERTYVELDLPTISRLKGQVIEQLRQEGVLPPEGNQNLILEAGDGLDPAAVERAARHLAPDKPVTVLTEGLLHYLDLDERDALARNIGAVLRKAGGMWVTDMPTQEGISEEDRQMAQRTSVLSGRDVAGNRFETHNDAREFFAARGLVIQELRSFLTVVDRLESPRTLHIPPQQVDAMTRPWSMWIFRAE